jgi:DNA-binding GntR family transcriptional regulator
MRSEAKALRQTSDRARARGDRVSLAYRQLRELIISGRLAPGTRIIETDVANRLGVSRTPVRSALQRLQQEGYIVEAGTGQQSRLSVAPLTQDDARELFAIVAHVEGLAAQWAAAREERERARTGRELRRLNDELGRAAHSAKPDQRRLFDLDQGFHRCYVEAGAGPRLLALHDAIKPQSERYVRLYITALVDQIGTSVQEHTAIIEGIERGEPELAKTRVLENWRNAAERLSAVIADMGERGSW